MQQSTSLGGDALAQSPRHAGLSAVRSPQSAIPSAPRVLMTTAQAARDIFGVSERKFQEMRGQPWMPQPVVLGPRLVRWVRSELEQAAMSIPRNQPLSEPAHLVRGKVAKLKRATSTPGQMATA